MKDDLGFGLALIVIPVGFHTTSTAIHQHPTTHQPHIDHTLTMAERPILRTSYSSPASSRPTSPSLRPSIVHSQASYQSAHSGGADRTGTPPLSSPTSTHGPRVTFPGEQQQQQVQMQPQQMQFSSTTTTTTGLPSSPSPSPSDAHAQEPPLHLSPETHYPHPRKTSGSHMSVPKTRTSSSGQTGFTGPEFGYTRKVGFETFEKSTEAALFSYTLQAKSDSYRRTRNTRVFMVAVSSDESGNEALEWLMESLIEDGDEIVAVRVVELDEGEKASKDAQEGFRDEAGGLLRKVLEVNDEVSDRQVSVIVEFVAGRVTDTLMRLISLYRPDCESRPLSLSLTISHPPTISYHLDATCPALIVGTKGSRSTFQKFGAAFGAPGMGSVSRYCVSHSPVPVIVVRCVPRPFPCSCDGPLT
jgi:nucleotide-binding universal stress UspA family protein